MTEEGYESSEKGVSRDRGGDAVLDVSEINAGTAVGRTSLALSCAHNVPFESTRTEDLTSNWQLISQWHKEEGVLTYSLSK